MSSTTATSSANRRAVATASAAVGLEPTKTVERSSCLSLSDFLQLCRESFADMQVLEETSYYSSVELAVREMKAPPLPWEREQRRLDAVLRKMPHFVGSISCVRLQQYVVDRHSGAYDLYVTQSPTYSGQWHRFIQVELELRCFVYKELDYLAAPTLTTHIAANELRCVSERTPESLVRWSDAMLGFAFSRRYLTPSRLLRVAFALNGANRCCEACYQWVKINNDAVVEVGGGCAARAECSHALTRKNRTKMSPSATPGVGSPCGVLVQMCAPLEECHSVELFRFVKVASREASKLLSRCEGRGMYSHISRAQLRLAMSRALTALCRICPSCRGMASSKKGSGLGDVPLESLFSPLPPTPPHPLTASTFYPPSAAAFFASAPEPLSDACSTPSPILSGALAQPVAAALTPEPSCHTPHFCDRCTPCSAPLPIGEALPSEGMGDVRASLVPSSPYHAYQPYQPMMGNELYSMSSMTAAAAAPVKTPWSGGRPRAAVPVREDDPPPTPTALKKAGSTYRHNPYTPVVIMDVDQAYSGEPPHQQEEIRFESWAPPAPARWSDSLAGPNSSSAAPSRSYRHQPYFPLLVAPLSDSWEPIPDSSPAAPESCSRWSSAAVAGDRTDTPPALNNGDDIDHHTSPFRQRKSRSSWSPHGTPSIGMEPQG